MTLADRMQRLHVPGVSIAIMHGGTIVSHGFGVAAVGGEPVTADTLFQAGSISKPVTALAALMLVQARSSTWMPTPTFTSRAGKSRPTRSLKKSHCDGC